MQTAYNITKVGVGVITVLSLASMSQNPKNSMTTCVPADYRYEAASLFSDNIGDVCTSSELQNNVVGNIMLENENNSTLDFVPKHKTENVKLNITDISKHVSRFDFEEEYEEI